MPDRVVHRVEDFLCHRTRMILRPAPNFRVQEANQSFLGRCFVRLHHIPDVVQKGFRVLFGRFGEEFSLMFANLPSEKVESLRNMRDPGLFLAKFKSSL